ncbi:MAG: ABC transporter permease [Pseudomonadota bacterium]|nr:ABC transporter permease [Pseudomonadota bacterium]
MRALLRYAPLLIVALAWEAVSRAGLVSHALLPSFSNVAAAFIGLVRDGSLLQNGAQSIWRALLGFLAAVVVGSALGAGMALSPRVRLAVNPLVQIFYPLPKSALIPLVLVWFGLGNQSKTFLVFLGCLLPMILSTFNGLNGIDPVLAWSARSLGASRSQVVREILLPAAMPQILTGIRTTIAFMFLLMVSSELVIATNGLGFMIGMLGDNGAYPAMFAVILTVTALGFLADRGFLAVSRFVLRWRE